MRTSGSRVYWLCCAGTMCLAIAPNLPPVFLTTFGETFGGSVGLSPEQLGAISGTAFAGFVAGIAICSPLADRFGAKTFVVAGLLLLCAGLVLLGSAWSYGALLAAVGCLGAGAGTLEVVLSPVVAALQPHRRTTALNWLHSFYCVGAVCIVLIGAVALRYHVSWRLVAFAVTAAPVLVLLGFLSSGPLTLVHEDTACEPIGTLLRRPFFMATLVLIGLGGATEIGMAQWLPAYAEQGLGYTKAAGGVALAAFSVAMMTGRMLIGFVAARMHAIPLMLACCAASATLILTGSFVPFDSCALAACVALGMTVCCFWPTTLALASDRFPHGGAFMFGILAAFGNSGCMVMPWVVGFVAERRDLHWGIASTAICPLGMGVILTVLGLRARRRAERELAAILPEGACPHSNSMP